MPAPTSEAAVPERMCPSSTAIVVMATTSGSSVAEKNGQGDALARLEDVAVEQQRRHPAHDQEEDEEHRQLEHADGSSPSASRSKLMPLTTKKNGMKKP